jgi:hypothetical protein
MVVAEAFLLAPSVAIAANGLAPAATPTWLDTLAMSVMPLQYAVVILAAHRLAGHYSAVATSVEVPTPAEPTTLATTPPLPETAATPSTSRPRLAMTDGRRQAAERYAAVADQIGDDVAKVASQVGRAKRTVRRWRSDAQALGLV